MIEFVPEHLRAIHISGADAMDFVQSQVTLDLTDSAQDQFSPAAWCDPKGRAIVVMLLVHRQNHVMAVLPTDQAVPISRRLNLFKIGRDADISEPQPFLARNGHNDSAQEHDASWCSLLHDQDRSILFSFEPPVMTHSQPIINADLDWIKADYASGFPWLSPQTGGLFIPQMLGLETLQGLSYKKGCYPGQEIIARVHYRGRVTKKPMKFELYSRSSLSAGTEFPIENNKGTVLNVIQDRTAEDRGGLVYRFSGLAVVPIQTPDQEPFFLNGEEGRLLAL